MITAIIILIITTTTSIMSDLHTPEYHGLILHILMGMRGAIEGVTFPPIGQDIGPLHEQTGTGGSTASGQDDTWHAGLLQHGGDPLIVHIEGGAGVVDVISQAGAIEEADAVQDRGDATQHVHYLLTHTGENVDRAASKEGY